VTDDKDWRLRGQESYLHGATLVRKLYWNRRPDDDHDHCEFCWAKFMVEPYEGATEEILAVGYAVQDRTADEDFPNDYYWVCPTCVRDFAKRFQWTVIEDPTSPSTVWERG
jgi:hypothetical protein